MPWSRFANFCVRGVGAVEVALDELEPSNAAPVDGRPGRDAVTFWSDVQCMSRTCWNRGHSSIFVALM